VIGLADTRTTLLLDFDALRDPEDNVDSIGASTLTVTLSRNGVVVDPFSNWQECVIGRTFFTYKVRF
jgi:hypothetical protein